MNSHHADALVADGLALQKAGKRPESIGCFLEAARLHPTPRTYRHLVRAQLESNTPEQASVSCRAAIELYPHEPLFFQLLAQAEKRLGRLESAATVLDGAFRAFPANAEIAAEYADTLIRAHHFARAIPALDRVIALKPGADVYLALVKMKTLLGDKAGARRAGLEGRERFPLDPALAAYCADFAPEAAARSHEAMRKAAVSQDPAGRSRLLGYLTTAQAAANRRDAGLLRDGARDWSDLVLWADPAGLAEYCASLDVEFKAAPRAETVIARASAAVGRMDWAGADSWLEQARRMSTGTVADVASFDPEFYENLETAAADVAAPFPPVVDVLARRDWPPVMLYVACDPKYFELFFARFVGSLSAHGGSVGVHAHLLDGTADVWSSLAEGNVCSGLPSFSMSAESSGALARMGKRARDYYHAARFVRFHQYLSRSPRPVWIMDVDTLAEADPATVWASIDGCDIAVTTAPLSLEPWGKIRAGIVGASPTDMGLRYARLVGAYISHWFARDSLRWGIDQQALFGAYCFLARRGEEPRTRFLTEEVMTVRDDLAAIFRPVIDAARWEKNR